jgi:hypothetical protein
MITTHKLILLALLAEAFTPLHARLSQQVDQRLDGILRSLNETEKVSEYSTDQFLIDLKAVSTEFHEGRDSTVDSSVSHLKRELIVLADALNSEQERERLKELRDWYGGYTHELPDKYFSSYVQEWSKTAQRFQALSPEPYDGPFTAEALRERLRSGPGSHTKIVSYRPPVVELKKEHSVAEYLHAWAFWLIAPPSKARDFMEGKINTALEAIGDENVIPLIVEALKIDTGRTGREDFKRETAFAHINLICGMPGEKAVDALLEINRHAIESGINGDDHFKSITRHITRRLASRRAYADQLIDPKLKETISRQGYNEKPEDIPLTDELWKKYKPLLESRLAAKTEETLKADIELIKGALEIMPRG